jgi:Kef-type K+ transport system membrane component KefB
MELFTEISIILLIALILSIFMRLLKQPLVIGYILAGIILGPYALNMIHGTEMIELFSKLGITILLFIVGLNLNPTVIRELGKVSLITGIMQVVCTSAVGFILSIVLGLDRVAALYVGIALTFSSTIIILKLLADKGDLNKLYGRIAVGFLIVQDVIATILLLVTSAVSEKNGTNLYGFIIWTIVKGGMLIGVLFFISTVLLPRIHKFIAKSPEFLFLFSLTWGLTLASLFHVFGFSVEIGALVAGVTLSMTPYAYEISSRLRPLRDFFIILFFILLGSQMVLANLISILIPALILSVFVLIGNPVIMIIIMNLLGFSRRTSFLTGMTVAQISEFSLILAALGFQVGHISKDVLSLITLVAVITISGSTYLILYAEKLYQRLDHLLIYLELKKNKKDASSEVEYESILFGYQRVGMDFIRAFEKLGLDFIVVDFNPEAIEVLKSEGIPCKFGDATDPEFIGELEFKRLKYLVTTIPEHKVNVFLTEKLRKVNTKAIIISISQNREEAQELYGAGATYVLMPHYLGAQYATKLIQKYGLSKREFEHERKIHLLYLEKRTI